MTWSSNMRGRIVKVAAVFAIVAILATGLNALFSRGVHGSGSCTPATCGGGGGFPMLVSDHWSGYVANGPSRNASVFARVTLPNVTCNSENKALAMWVGYGGDSASDPRVVQDGVRADCTRIQGKLTPYYWLWWELFPANKPNQGNKQLQKLSSQLKANYTVDMYVDAPLLACDLYLRSGSCIHWTHGAYFALTVYDANGAYVGSWSDIVPFPPFYSPKLASSECIVEDPYNGAYNAPMPSFSPVLFKNCTVFSSGNPVHGLILQRNGPPLATPHFLTYTSANNTLFEVVQGS